MKEVSPMKSVNDLKAVLAFFEKQDLRMFHLVRIGINVRLCRRTGGSVHLSHGVFLAKITEKRAVSGELSH